MTGELILIVEDEPAVVRGLEFGLEKAGFKTSRASNGTQAIELTQKEDPQLILLDLRLPDMTGFDVCRKIRSQGKRQPILILTALDDEMDKVLGLELGADDYVIKPYQLRELIARIHALLRRAYGELSTSSLGEKIIFGDIVIDLETLQVYRKGNLIYLTPIEFRMLRYLASHPNKPIPRNVLIEAVWGYEETFGSDRMVDVHLRHLRQKIEEDPANPQFLITVRGIGYKFQAGSRNI